MNFTCVKRIVCLANSRKIGGSCVAGKELLPADGNRAQRVGGWIRPVSARQNEELSENERQYEDRTDPRVLDVIDVPLLEARPKDYQQENWLIDDSRYWTKAGHITPGHLNDILDPLRSLWLNGHSSINGLNDRVPSDTALGLRDSLRLLKVNDLTLLTSVPGSVQGRFQYHGTSHWLRVTDPNYHRRYLPQTGDDIEIGECFLTISLGELFQGHSYKLIAAIIQQ